MGSSGIPAANQDLSQGNIEDEVDTKSPASKSTNTSFKSSNTSLNSTTSVTSTKSYPGRVMKRNSKPRSPSERKIGIVRRRSQEMALKKALLRDEKKKYLLPSAANDCYVKTQLKRGRPNTFCVKPSPMKVENSTPDGRKTTRIKISFREGQLQSPKIHIRVSLRITHLELKSSFVISFSFFSESTRTYS